MFHLHVTFVVYLNGSLACFVSLHHVAFQFCLHCVNYLSIRLEQEHSCNGWLYRTT